MNLKVCFETFGCRLSRAEALEDEARYLAAGYERVESHREADVIVVRGCSVTGRAQRDCEKLIDHLKRHYPAKRLVVTGCLPKDRLTNFDPLKDEPPALAVPTRTARAYLKVQDGCAGKCTFCIVPTFRGKSVSVDFDAVMDKAKRFVDAGYQELVVTGCNLALYASKGKKLSELAAALSQLARVRIGSVEPGPAARELVEAMAENENICRFLHLPIQSGSSKVLSAMGRPYTVKEVDELIKYATAKMPRLALGADFITGFPGETDFDYLATVGLLKRHQFAKVHVFPYSERPGTVAVGFPDKLPREICSRRAKELAALAKPIRSAYARKFVGQTVEIIVEEEKKHAGWTGEYLWCEVSKAVQAETLPPRKSRLKLRVLRATGGCLLATPVA